MLIDRLASLPEHAVAFDTETAMVQPGLLAPPLVCGSMAQMIDGRISGRLLSKDEALEVFREIVESPTAVMVGAFICFDILVCLVEWAKRGVDLRAKVWKMFEEGRVYDILIGEALNAIADGCLAKDPKSKGDLKDPKTGRPTKRYSLDICTFLTLDRSDAKINDVWRKRYWLLVDVPMEDWPREAREYPVDDAVNTLEVALAHTGHIAKKVSHRWTIVDGAADATCEFCARPLTAGASATPCFTELAHRNLHSMAVQVETAWAMHLGAAWGFRVNHAAVDKVERAALLKRERLSAPLVEAGLLEWTHAKGEDSLKKNQGAISRAVATAFGAKGCCTTCAGTGRVRSPKAKLVGCKSCKVTKKNPPKPDCEICRGTGKAPTETQRVGCSDCCNTGLDLETAPTVRRTDPSDKFPNGQIESSRDVLSEAGDETLRELAEYGADAKTVQTYIPYLRSAGTKPLTLKPNVLLETDRTSYGDTIQQFPRAGGLRECLIARDGKVLISVDYNQGELITLAQVQLWMFGHSELANAILEGAEPHKALGAQLLGLSYEEFCRRFDAGDKDCKAARQAAKAANFGLPGGMGVVRLVLTQRKQGPDTPCANGPTILDDKGTRGYRGMRLCILMDKAERCGVEMTTEWGKPGYERQCDPVCVHCLKCGERLRDAWFERWSEMKAYFKLAGRVEGEGQQFLGAHLAQGEMLLPGSGIIRGGCEYSSTANGYFQATLAYAAKLALRRAQRECTDPDFRLPNGERSPLYGSRVIVFQHDEVIAEVPEELGHECGERLSLILVEALAEICPDMRAAIKAPAASMRRWLKAAEPEFVNGRLVPWEPQQKKAA